MYELQYTQQIIDAIIHELPKEISAESQRRIKSIQVLLGEKYQLDPEIIRSHYLELVSGTPLEGIILDMDQANVEVLCNACGSRGPVREREYLICSSCKSQNVKSIAGEVVNIKNIEFSESLE